MNRLFQTFALNYHLTLHEDASESFTGIDDHSTYNKQVYIIPSMKTSSIY